MANYKELPLLKLDDTFPFGKHKGKTVAEVVGDFPDYLLWLRNARWADNSEGKPDSAGFSDEVHELLDEYLEGNTKMLNVGYKFRFPGGREKKEVADSMTQEKRAEVQKSTAGWGDW